MEGKDSEKEILSISEIEVEQMLKLFPDLKETTTKDGHLLVRGQAKIREVESQDQEKHRELFLVVLDLQGHKGISEQNRNFPRFCIPLSKAQLLQLVSLLERILFPHSFEGRLLDLLERIEKKLPEKSP